MVNLSRKRGAIFLELLEVLMQIEMKQMGSYVGMGGQGGAAPPPEATTL